MKTRLTFKYVITDESGRIARQIFSSIKLDIPEEIKIYENEKWKFIDIRKCDLFSCEFLDNSTKVE